MRITLVIGLFCLVQLCTACLFKCRICDVDNWKVKDFAKNMIYNYDCLDNLKKYPTRECPSCLLMVYTSYDSESKSGLVKIKRSCSDDKVNICNFKLIGTKFENRCFFSCQSNCKIRESSKKSLLFPVCMHCEENVQLNRVDGACYNALKKDKNVILDICLTSCFSRVLVTRDTLKISRGCTGDSDLGQFRYKSLINGVVSGIVCKANLYDPCNSQIITLDAELYKTAKLMDGLSIRQCLFCESSRTLDSEPTKCEQGVAANDFNYATCNTKCVAAAYYNSTNKMFTVNRYCQATSQYYANDDFSYLPDIKDSKYNCNDNLKKQCYSSCIPRFGKLCNILHFTFERRDSSINSEYKQDNDVVDYPRAKNVKFMYSVISEHLSSFSNIENIKDKEKVKSNFLNSNVGQDTLTKKSLRNDNFIKFSKKMGGFDMPGSLDNVVIRCMDGFSCASNERLSETPEIDPQEPIQEDTPIVSVEEHSENEIRRIESELDDKVSVLDEKERLLLSDVDSELDKSVLDKNEDKSSEIDKNERLQLSDVEDNVKEIKRIESELDEKISVLDDKEILQLSDVDDKLDSLFGESDIKRELLENRLEIERAKALANSEIEFIKAELLKKEKTNENDKIIKQIKSIEDKMMKTKINKKFDASLDAEMKTLEEKITNKESEIESEIEDDNKVQLKTELDDLKNERQTLDERKSTAFKYDAAFDKRIELNKQMKELQKEEKIRKINDKQINLLEKAIEKTTKNLDDVKTKIKTNKLILENINESDLEIEKKNQAISEATDDDAIKELKEQLKSLKDDKKMQTNKLAKNEQKNNIKKEDVLMKKLKKMNSQLDSLNAKFVTPPMEIAASKYKSDLEIQRVEESMLNNQNIKNQEIKDQIEKNIGSIKNIDEKENKDDNDIMEVSNLEKLNIELTSTIEEVEPAALENVKEKILALENKIDEFNKYDSNLESAKKINHEIEETKVELELKLKEDIENIIDNEEIAKLKQNIAEKIQNKKAIDQLIEDQTRALSLQSGQDIEVVSVSTRLQTLKDELANTNKDIEYLGKSVHSDLVKKIDNIRLKAANAIINDLEKKTKKNTKLIEGTLKKEQSLADKIDKMNSKNKRIAEKKIELLQHERSMITQKAADNQIEARLKLNLYINKDQMPESLKKRIYDYSLNLDEDELKKDISEHAEINLRLKNQYKEIELKYDIENNKDFIDSKYEKAIGRINKKIDKLENQITKSMEPESDVENKDVKEGDVKSGSDNEGDVKSGSDNEGGVKSGSDNDEKLSDKSDTPKKGSTFMEKMHKLNDANKQNMKSLWNKFPFFGRKKLTEEQMNSKKEEINQLKQSIDKLENQRTQDLELNNNGKYYGKNHDKMMKSIDQLNQKSESAITKLNDKKLIIMKDIDSLKNEIIDKSNKKLMNALKKKESSLNRITSQISKTQKNFAIKYDQIRSKGQRSGIIKKSFFQKFVKNGKALNTWKKRRIAALSIGLIAFVEGGVLAYKFALRNMMKEDVPINNYEMNITESDVIVNSTVVTYPDVKTKLPVTQTTTQTTVFEKEVTTKEDNELPITPIKETGSVKITDDNIEKKPEDENQILGIVIGISILVLACCILAYLMILRGKPANTVRDKSQTRLEISSIVGSESQNGR